MRLRVLAVLAAVFLVAAVALGSLLPVNEPMGQVLANVNGVWLADLQGLIVGRLGGWAWEHVTVPMLVRPSWLIPLAAGILCVGAATSMIWRKTPSRPRRGRS